jgi:hypothetical protein
MSSGGKVAYANMRNQNYASGSDDQALLVAVSILAIILPPPHLRANKNIY